VLKIDPAGHVTFFAGDANLFQPGTMDAAVFSAPTGIAVDSHDNVYVADSGHLRIWKVDPSGAVTSFAGDGTYGALYGSASTGPYGGLTLTTDVHDNLYVADWGSMTVRKLSPSGQLSAVPGDDVDETSPRTLLYGAVGLAADAAGTVYVLIGGCTSPWVRQLDPHGNATQLQDLTQPAAIATDLQGRLLRATTTQIERLEADRTNIVMAGIDESGSLNAATRHDGSAEFATPLGLTAIKDHRVVVADADNHVLRAVDACGEVSTFAGDGTDGFLDGPAAKARFSNPTSVARDDAHGLLFVADPGNHRIRAITDDGQVVTFAGNGGSSSKDGTGGPNGTAEFDLIVAIALSPQGLFVSELSEGKNLTKLRLVDLAGTVTTRANTYGGNELALAPDGSLYVTYDDGSLWHLPADPSKAAVHLRLHLASDPYDEPLAYLVTVDHQGYVFISDGASVSAVDERGNLTPLALVVDPNNLLTNPDADPASASGLAVDDEGHIFVSDARRHCIRVITP
jgi:sugar lactone lactonase YvrE